MIGSYILIAIALVAAGAVIGALAVVSLGIRRDDRRNGFPASTDDRIARGARRMTGAAARSPELDREASRRRRRDSLPV